MAARRGGATTVTLRQVWSDLLENGTPYDLAHGVRLTRGRVGRNDVIQVHPGNNAQRLMQLGVKYERGVVPLYYITTDEAGRAVLGRVLEEFPVAPGRGSGERGAVTLDFLTFGTQLIRDGVVKFAEWSKRMIARFGEASGAICSRSTTRPRRRRGTSSATSGDQSAASNYPSAGRA